MKASYVSFYGGLFLISQEIVFCGMKQRPENVTGQADWFLREIQYMHDNLAVDQMV